MGLTRDHPDPCGNSSLVSHAVTEGTLEFEVLETDLPQVANCQTTSGAMSSVTCVLHVSVIDLVHWRTHTQTVQVQTRSAAAHVVHLAGQHTYVPLTDFSVDMTYMFTRVSGSAVVQIVTRVGSAQPVRVDMRVQHMSSTALSVDEQLGCQRHAADSGSVESTSIQLAAGTTQTFSTYWEGAGKVLHALYTLHLDGNGTNIMDVAAVRNLSRQLPACQPAPVTAAVGMGDVRSGAGMGAAIAASLSLLPDTQSTSGELGQLITFVAEAVDPGVRTIRLQNMVVAYARNTALPHMYKGIARTHVVRGVLEFTPAFRHFCNAIPDDCVYEYMNRHALHDTTYPVSCDDADAARQWLQQALGVVHDGGHVQTLCASVQARQTQNLQTMPLLVHTMRFLDRTGPGWNHYQQNRNATKTFVWALFSFDLE